MTDEEAKRAAEAWVDKVLGSTDRLFRAGRELKAEMVEAMRQKSPMTDEEAKAMREAMSQAPMCEHGQVRGVCSVCYVLGRPAD